MKNTIQKLTTLAILATAILSTTTVARSADSDGAAPAKKEKASGEKFYGAITALDTNAKTLTVSDQVYTVSDKTEITSAKDDKKITLADAVVGEPARGTYTKGTDGKLNVDKVRLGKKAGGKSGGKSGGKKNKGTGAATTNAPAATTEN